LEHFTSVFSITCHPATRSRNPAWYGAHHQF
jgi:hypothetical protein